MPEPEGIVEVDLEDGDLLTMEVLTWPYPYDSELFRRADCSGTAFTWCPSAILESLCGT